MGPVPPLPKDFDDVDNNDVLQFQEFNLNPLELSGTAHLLIPHRHRDATRTFSLRLQPTAKSELGTSLKTFQDHTFLKYGPNQAHQSPLHLSLQGNIPIECLDDYRRKWQHADEFVAIVHEEVKRLLSPLATQQHDFPQPAFGGYVAKDKPTRSVAMRVAVPRVYLELANAIDNRLTDDLSIKLDHPCAPVTSASSAIQRMPLAYNVLHSISKQDAQLIKDSANSLIDVKKWCAGKEISWELSLQEILLQSQSMGETQQVTVIQTWPLEPIGFKQALAKAEHDKRKSMALVPFTPKPALPKPHTKSFSLIPASIRVKLSILSTWFR
ncbi:hypothetical protein DM01DRAFT_1385448 [Hesseltinella vesiculosa]|uniref:Uncharacterized protein n=1 Tax=Hesseltinella vesiculosa TaxID=101127 RepID=A0A1X2G9E9_9FUNG|nr:hypothetical protein DM01DRAFT_1385448 [Hesseltinella vesiculosa]